MREEQIVKGNTILKKMHVFQKVVAGQNVTVHNHQLKIELGEEISDCIFDELEDFKKQANEAWTAFAQEKLDELQKELEAL